MRIRRSCCSKPSTRKARQTICSPTSQNPASISKRSSRRVAAPGTVDPELRTELERASSGLVFSSETGRPFEFFALAYPGRNATPSAADFATLIGEPAAASQEISLASFFAPHTVTSDPYDSDAQKMRPRYEALTRLLSTKLRDTKVYMIGGRRVDCYAAGLDARGNLAGIKTIIAADQK